MIPYIGNSVIYGGILQYLNVCWYCTTVDRISTGSCILFFLRWVMSNQSWQALGEKVQHLDRGRGKVEY